LRDDILRSNLSEYEGKKIRVFGTLIKKQGFQTGVSYLFQDIKTPDGEYLTDHICIIPCKKVRRMKLKPGMRVMFDTVVRKYSKVDNSPKYRGVKPYFHVSDYGFSEMSNPEKFTDTGNRSTV